MRHEISPETWEDYMENTLAAAERNRVSAHLEACAECRAMAAQASHSTARLHGTARQINAAWAVSDEKLETAWQAALAQLKAEAVPVRERLDELEATMTVLCGAHTAAQALQAAAAESPARSLARLTRENWEPFLRSLLAIVRALCGRTGARLILESGQL